MPSPVKFHCIAHDLNCAAKWHLGFKNVWPENEVDARNLVLTLLELVAPACDVDVQVECRQPRKEEETHLFHIELTLSGLNPLGRVWVGDESRTEAEEFRRVVRELQTMILSH